MTKASKSKNFIRQYFINLSLLTLLSVSYFNLRDIKVNNNVWLKESNPIERNENYAIKTFEAKTAAILTIIKLPDNIQYFSDKNIAELSKVQEEISRIPSYYNSQSPLHNSIAISKNETLNIKTFKESIDDGTIESLEEYQEKLTSSKYFKSTLSKNFQYFIINSNFKINESNKAEQKQFITQEIKKIFAKYPNYQDYKISGKIFLDDKLNQNIAKDLNLLILLGSLAITTLLTIIYKSTFKVIASAYPAILATICAMHIIQISFGFFTALDLITLISIMAISISDSTHILAKWEKINQRETSSKIKKLIKITYKPCLTTSLTTAIGFGSFYFSEIIPLKNFAFSAFFSILLSYLIIMIFTILLIAVNSKEVALKKQIEFLFIKNNLSKITDFSITNKISICAFTLIISLGSIYFYSKNFNESNFINIFFKKSSTPYQAITQLDQKFTGSGNINLVFKGRQQNFFKNIETFNEIKNLGKKLSKLTEVTNVRSYIDPIEQIHQEITLDQSKMPQSNQELEQEILFIEMSRNENQKDILAKHVDFNYQNSRISISTNNLSSRQLGLTLKKIDSIVQNSQIVDQVEYSFSGQNIYFYKINQYIEKSFKSSILVTIFTIFIIMSLLYSVKLALISTTVSSLPFLIILGIISIAKIPLDYATIIIGATTFAIAIDNSIHLIDNYAKTQNINKNLEQIYLPLTINTFLFSVTFLTFCLSSLVLLNKFGFFSFLNIVIAFVANLVLTSIMVFYFSRPNDRPYADPRSVRR